MTIDVFENIVTNFAFTILVTTIVIIWQLAERAPPLALGPRGTLLQKSRKTHRRLATLPFLAWALQANSLFRRFVLACPMRVGDPHDHVLRTWAVFFQSILVCALVAAIFAGLSVSRRKTQREGPFDLSSWPIAILMLATVLFEWAVGLAATTPNLL